MSFITAHATPFRQYLWWQTVQSTHALVYQNKIELYRNFRGAHLSKERGLICFTPSLRPNHGSNGSDKLILQEYSTSQEGSIDKAAGTIRVPYLKNTNSNFTVRAFGLSISRYRSLSDIDIDIRKGARAMRRPLQRRNGPYRVHLIPAEPLRIWACGLF